MASTVRLEALIDMLQKSLAEYIADKELLVEDYRLLLQENDNLRDKIAELMGESCHGCDGN